MIVPPVPDRRAPRGGLRRDRLDYRHSTGGFKARCDDRRVAWGLGICDSRDDEPEARPETDMLTKIRNLFSDLMARKPEKAFDLDDPRLAVAALMFHVIAVDGVVTAQEKARWLEELSRRFGLPAEEAQALAEAGRAAELETADLMNFTAGLKTRLELAERLDVVRALWTMVLADGEIHEFEDDVVWRIADLLEIDPPDRMILRKEVEAEHAAATLKGLEDGR